jgi:hypothetical protein
VVTKSLTSDEGGGLLFTVSARNTSDTVAWLTQASCHWAELRSDKNESGVPDYPGAGVPACPRVEVSRRVSPGDSLIVQQSIRPSWVRGYLLPGVYSIWITLPLAEQSASPTSQWQKIRVGRINWLG